MKANNGLVASSSMYDFLHVHVSVWSFSECTLTFRHLLQELLFYELQGELPRVHSYAVHEHELTVQFVVRCYFQKWNLKFIF